MPDAGSTDYVKPQADALSALHDLIYLVRSGEFYSDHDDSLAVLGRAEAGLVVVSDLLHAIDKIPAAVGEVQRMAARARSLYDADGAERRTQGKSPSSNAYVARHCLGTVETGLNYVQRLLRDASKP